MCVHRARSFVNILYLCRMDEMMSTNKKWRELLWDDVQKADDGLDDELLLMGGGNKDETDLISKEVDASYTGQTIYIYIDKI